MKEPRSWEIHFTNNLICYQEVSKCGHQEPSQEPYKENKALYTGSTKKLLVNQDLIECEITVWD